MASGMPACMQIMRREDLPAAERAGERREREEAAGRLAGPVHGAGRWRGIFGKMGMVAAVRWKFLRGLFLSGLMVIMIVMRMIVRG